MFKNIKNSEMFGNEKRYISRLSLEYISWEKLLVNVPFSIVISPENC